MLIKQTSNWGNGFITLPIGGRNLFKTDQFYVKKLFIKNKKNT
jgi:hypothetical protein